MKLSALPWLLFLSQANGANVIGRTTSLQVVVNKHTIPGDAMADGAWKAFDELNPLYPRLAPWYVLPQHSIAELEPPTDNSTSWNFTFVDKGVLPFLDRTKGRSPILCFGATPAWMWNKTAYSYPDDPEESDYGYDSQGGTDNMLDPTGEQIAEYQARVFSWYTQGGFDDELGVHHSSGYEYSFPIYGVLNEIDMEHAISPKNYTLIYDATVSKIQALSPETKFMGLSLAPPTGRTDAQYDTWFAYFPYFLNASNHKSGIPIDYIGYDFYALPDVNETAEDWQYTFYEYADKLLGYIQDVEVVRKELSPNTQTILNEVGALLPDDVQYASSGIDPRYWSGVGALYVYIYIRLSQLGIDSIKVMCASQLVAYRGDGKVNGQTPSVTMIDFDTYEPNARFRVAELVGTISAGATILEEGDFDITVSSNQTSNDTVLYLGFKREGATERSVLLVNKLLSSANVTVAGAAGCLLNYTDVAHSDGARMKVESDSFELGGFSVALLELDRSYSG